MAPELLLQVTIPVVAQSYLQEVPRVASGPVVRAGVVPHGVVAVHRPASLLVQTRQDVVHVVWEEPLVVHEDRHHLRGGWCGHRLVVLLSEKKHVSQSDSYLHNRQTTLLRKVKTTMQTIESEQR